MFDEERFRAKAHALLSLPEDEREAAFSALIEQHQSEMFPMARTTEEVVENTRRLRLVWQIGADWCHGTAPSQSLKVRSQRFTVGPRKR